MNSRLAAELETERHHHGGYHHQAGRDDLSTASNDFH
jgi:hypothetical protein